MNELAEQIEKLQTALIIQATGGTADDKEYQRLRLLITGHPVLKDIAPKFLRTCRNLSQFWHFIKYEGGTYGERRQFIWDKVRPLLELAESRGVTPSDQGVSSTLRALDATSIDQLWSKAMERRENDPEGAVTLARTLLESVCKHILDRRGTCYKHDADLPALYKATSTELNIAPSQHSEQIFKQILGGCTAVVEGLGALRNRLSDAHGQGKLSVKPAPRHAELAVNLSGAVAQFLIATDEHTRKQAK